MTGGYSFIDDSILWNNLYSCLSKTNHRNHPTREAVTFRQDMLCYFWLIYNVGLEVKAGLQMFV